MTQDELPPIVGQPISATKEPAPDGVRHSRPLIFAILFGVTGALGLPLLWYSPVFSRNEKVWWTIINLAYTAALLAMAAAAIMVIRRALLELQL